MVKICFYLSWHPPNWRQYSKIFIKNIISDRSRGAGAEVANNGAVSPRCPKIISAPPAPAPQHCPIQHTVVRENYWERKKLMHLNYYQIVIGLIGFNCFNWFNWFGHLSLELLAAKFYSADFWVIRDPGIGYGSSLSNLFG